MKLKHSTSGAARVRQHRLRLAAVAVAGTAALFATPTTVALAAPSTVEVARAADPVVDLTQEALSSLASNGFDPAAPAYAAKRDVVATAIAARLAIDPQQMIAAWSIADLEHQQALLTGLSQLGVPYRRNTSAPGVGFDCSGLTTYAWAGAGVTLVRQSSAQMQAAAPRTIETAQAGDLMQYPGHVMMWLGVGRAALQAPNPGRTVEVVLYRTGRRVRIGDPTG